MNTCSSLVTQYRILSADFHLTHVCHVPGGTPITGGGGGRLNDRLVPPRVVNPKMAIEPRKKDI